MSIIKEEDWESKVEKSFQELVNSTKGNKSINICDIKKAFDMARIAHSGQFRASNEPYIMHPLEVAKIVVSLKMDTPSVITALLHDTIEDTTLTYEKIKDCFKEQIANMVKGITKLTSIESKITVVSIEDKKAEDYRNLMCAVSKDIRVLIVKLADRMHNMRTLHHINNKEKRMRIAIETMDIHSALAERLGMYHFKNELQELAFAELYPEEEKNIDIQLKQLRKDGKDLVKDIIIELKKVLSDPDIGTVKVVGREKKLSSIWKKIQNKKLSFENLYDIFAFRVIVKNTKSCYKALCLIHNKYHMVPGEFKDYISTPKTNGYRSLHTVIIGPNNKRIEVQIRTEKMHKIAEFGIAAHWRYKQKLEKINHKEDLTWVGEILSILQNSSTSAEIFENSKLEMYYYQVFCFSSEGNLITLPKGATVLDFAFYVDSKTAIKFTGATVNKENVPIAYKLQDGDQVDIIYAKENRASESWEEFLQTGKGKTELKKYLTKKDKDNFIKIGEYIYLKCLTKLNIDYDRSKILLPLKDVTECENIDDLFYLIGKNKLEASKVVNALYPKIGIIKRIPNFFALMHEKITKKTMQSNTSISQLYKNIDLYFAECCFPVKEEKAVEFLDRNKGKCIIHRARCNKISYLYEQHNQIALFDWSVSNKKMYESKIIILVSDELIKSLKEIVDYIYNFDINLINITITNQFERVTEFTIIVEVKDINHLDNLLIALNNLKLLYSVVRYLED